MLDHLDDYVSGRLDEAVRAAADAHLLACPQCERFGGVYAGLVASLRRELGAPPPLDAGVARRLTDGLDALTREPGGP